MLTSLLLLAGWECRRIQKNQDLLDHFDTCHLFSVGLFRHWHPCPDNSLHPPSVLCPDNSEYGQCFTYRVQNWYFKITGLAM